MVREQSESIERPMMKTRVNSLSFLGLLAMFLSLACSGQNEDWKNADRLVPLKEYSEEETREWEDVKHEHIPVVRLSIDQGEDALLIELPMLDSGFGHYIESIGILDEEGTLLSSRSIDRTHKPKTYAYFPLEPLSGKKRLKAFAKCNLHDTWVKEFRLDTLPRSQ